MSLSSYQYSTPLGAGLASRRPASNRLCRLLFVAVRSPVTRAGFDTCFAQRDLGFKTPDTVLSQAPIRAAIPVTVAASDC